MMSKDAVLSVRATKAFRDRLRQEAERRGLSLSGFLLTAALRELGWGDRIRVTYHHEDGTWWADSDDVPGYYAGAQTVDELRELVREGLRYHLIEEFYEDDEPVETIQRIRSRPPDFVTGPPQLCTLYVIPSPSGDGTFVQQVGPMTWASGGTLTWSAA